MNYNKTKNIVLKIIKSKQGLTLVRIAEEINCSITRLNKWLDAVKDSDVSITKKINDRLDFFKEYLNNNENKHNYNKIYISVIVSTLILLFMTIIFFTVYNLAGSNKSFIKITNPVDKSIINFGNMKKNDYGDLITEVNISYNKLPVNQYISLLVRVVGGNNYWYSGNSAVISSSGKGRVRIGYVSLGNINDNNSDYELIAIVTPSPQTSGASVYEIPETALLFSQPAYITVKKQ